MIEEYQSARKAVNAAAFSARLLVIFFVALCLSGFDHPDSDREDIVLLTKHGVQLSAHLYRPDTPAAEGALLIRGEDGTTGMFAVLAEQLRENGVAALVLDLSDRTVQSKDLRAALLRLGEELIPEAAILFAGFADGAGLAVDAANSTQSEGFWPTFCLIQPGPDVLTRPGIDGPDVSAVILVGRKDAAAGRIARDLYRTGTAPRDIWQLDGGRGISETMLQREDFCADLTEWFVDAASVHRDSRRRDEATSSNERR